MRDEVPLQVIHLHSKLARLHGGCKKIARQMIDDPGYPVRHVSFSLSAGCAICGNILKVGRITIRGVDGWTSEHNWLLTNQSNRSSCHIT
jgi:hypothetical protein